MAVVVLPTPPFWLATAITLPFSWLPLPCRGLAGSNSGGCIFLVNNQNKHVARADVAKSLFPAAVLCKHGGATEAPRHLPGAPRHPQVTVPRGTSATCWILLQHKKARAQRLDQGIC